VGINTFVRVVEEKKRNKITILSDKMTVLLEDR